MTPEYPGPEFKYVSDVLGVATKLANWAPARAAYVQYVHNRRPATASPIPDVLRDRLAKCLLDLAAGSYRGREEQLIEHALAVFAEVDNHERLSGSLFASHYLDRVDPRERKPSLFESTVETSRRLRDVRRLEEALAGIGISCVRCGSMIYAPFYGVRGHHGEEPASDLDLVIVISNATQLDAIAGRLSGIAGVDKCGVDQFRERVAIFAKHFDNHNTVLSQKITMWADELDSVVSKARLRGDYQMSLHFIRLHTFDYNLVDSSASLARTTAGGRRTVRDYRDTHTTRADLPRSFAGREHPVQPEIEAVDEGWLRSMTAYVFDDFDSYYTGFLQSILLPAPELRLDELGIEPRIRTFIEKFFDRYRLEQARHPDALLRPSFTHVRRDAFAPRVLRQFDGDE